MSDNILRKTSDKRHYNDVFDQLKYQNKVVLNEVADCLRQKKLNRLANRQILSEIADMALDCQNKDLPLDHLFGGDRAAFCERLSEKAPPAAAEEKIIEFLRNLSAVFLLAGVIASAVSLVGGNSIYLNGIRALQIMGGTLVALLFFPLACYRDALYMPLHAIVPVSKNVIEPDAAQLDIKSLLLRIVYSLVCAAGTIVYVIAFWVYPEVLIRSSLSNLSVNVLAWATISAVVFISFLAAETYVVTRNCRLNALK